VDAIVTGDPVGRRIEAEQRRLMGLAPGVVTRDLMDALAAACGFDADEFWSVLLDTYARFGGEEDDKGFPADTRAEIRRLRAELGRAESVCNTVQPRRRHETEGRDSAGGAGPPAVNSRAGQTGATVPEAHE
jgi:hypothetical protein